MTKQEIKNKLNDNPLAKTIGFFVSVMLTSIFSSALVVDITDTKGKLVWSNVWHSYITLLLAIILVLDFVYYWFVYQADIDVIQYGDDNFYANYIRQQSLPTLANRYIDDIKAGKRIEPVKSFLDNLK